MISYRPAPLFVPRQIGQIQTPSPVPAVTPSSPCPGISTIGMPPVARTALTAVGVAWTAAAAWVSLRVATRESGFVSVAGWVAGIGSILASATILGAALVGKHVPTPIDLIFQK